MILFQGPCDSRGRSSGSLGDQGVGLQVPEGGGVGLQGLRGPKDRLPEVKGLLGPGGQGVSQQCPKGSRARPTVQGPRGSRGRPTGQVICICGACKQLIEHFGSDDEHT